MENIDRSQMKVATPGHRVGAVAVDAGLYLATLGIGWFIWNLVTMAKGQSPGKNLLKVRVINVANGQPARWGHMFIRQALLPLFLSIFYLIPYYLWVYKEFSSDVNPVGVIALVLAFLLYLAFAIVDFIWLFGPQKRRLIDYWAGTVVANEA
jgi:uncharacterized RDD family membrane protein YckC